MKKRIIIIVLLMTALVFPKAVLAEESLKENNYDSKYEVTASK